MSDEDRTIKVDGREIRPGERMRLQMSVGRLPTQTPINLPVEVVNGADPGPRMFLTGCIHGDELNGIEIIRRVLSTVQPEALSGALYAVPIVNVYGFLQQSRYLPDRRDLNRSFPGSAKGSLAAQLADKVMKEVVRQCDVGVDLHTAAVHRDNLPQIRGDLADPEVRRLATAFRAPVQAAVRTPAGSLRAAARDNDVKVLTFEGGGPHRFSRPSILAGIGGVLRVMEALGMGEWPDQPKPAAETIEAGTTRWVRAPRSGLMRLDCRLGDRVERRQVIGFIGDAFDDDHVTLRAPAAGIVIGIATNPMVSRGEALVHLGIPGMPDEEPAKTAD